MACSNAVQGIAAAAGLGAVIMRVQPLFEAIKWAGVGYLFYLGVQALRSARRGEYAPVEDDGGQRRAGRAFGGWRQGFLSNITNPKVLVFYLAVLPQFLGGDAGVPVLILFALSHAVLSLAYLLILTASLHRLRGILLRRPGWRPGRRRGPRPVRPAPGLRGDDAGRIAVRPPGARACADDPPARAGR